MNNAHQNESLLVFDQNEKLNYKDLLQEARQIGATILDIAQLTIDFSQIERVPRYFIHKRENNAEHSLMLGFAAIEIGSKYYPGLDSGLLAKFAMVHDLLELETGDVATFNASPETLASKHEAEQAALIKLSRTLPTHLADALIWYEEQTQPEARLVRHIDKLLPYAVDIQGAGVTVMKEDYGVTSAQQVLEQNERLEARFQQMFPETEHDVLRKAHNVLANKFALTFEEQ